MTLYNFLMDSGTRRWGLFSVNNAFSFFINSTSALLSTLISNKWAEGGGGRPGRESFLFLILFLTKSNFFVGLSDSVCWERGLFCFFLFSAFWRVLFVEKANTYFLQFSSLQGRSEKSVFEINKSKF